MAEVDDDTVETFQRIYSALQRNDWEELAHNLAHDIEWTSPETLPWGGTRHGPGGIESFAELFAEHIDHREVPIDDCVHERVEDIGGAMPKQLRLLFDADRVHVVGD